MYASHARRTTLETYTVSTIILKNNKHNIFYKYALIINQVSCGIVIFKICYVLSQFNSIRIKDYSSHSPPTIQSRGRVALDIPN